MEEDRIDCLYWIYYHIVWGGGRSYWCWWPCLQGSSPMMRSFDIGSTWISTYWYIAWELVDWMGDRLGDPDGDPLGVVFLVLWDIHLFRRSGDQYLRSSFYLSLSGYWSGNRGLDQEIWSSSVISIGISCERLGVLLGDREKYWFSSVGLILVSSSGNSIGRGIARAIGRSIGRSWI